ncbi:MAG: substrate-binding domain-containing protein [bacterium]|nr:substrate-binding domain-containing protein [bacterium]
MKKIILSTLFLFVASVALQAQNFKVIVNEANATTSLSKKDVSEIFLKTKTSWDDGSKIVPVDQTARSATRAEFSQEIHGRSVGAIRSHWQQAAFSGAGTAPAERPSDAEVIAFVKNNPGAVGYISADADVSGVKVVAVN